MPTKTWKHPYGFLVHYQDTETATNDWIWNLHSLTDSRSGNSNPGWKKAITKGVQAGTTMSASRQIYSHKRAFDAIVHYKDVGGSPVWSRTTGLTTLAQAGGAGSSGMSTQKAQDQAMGKFLKQVRRVQTSMSGLTFLGELREALHMLRHPADALNRGLADYLHAVKRKKRANPKTWRKAIAGTWLEHSFGWQPFINDLKDAAKAYSRLKEVPHVEPISSSSSDQAYPIATTTTWGFSRYVNVRQNAYQEDDCFVKMRGAVWVQASGTSFDRDLFGFNLREFVPTAWELLPWSFLADYFSNIGDVLENSVTSTADLRWAIRSTVTTQRFSCLHYLNEPMISAVLGNRLIRTQTFSPGFHQSIGRSVFRETIAGTYTPPLRFELPGKSAQFLNMAALLASGNSIFPQSPRPWRKR